MNMQPRSKVRWAIILVAASRVGGRARPNTMTAPSAINAKAKTSRYILEA